MPLCSSATLTLANCLADDTDKTIAVPKKQITDFLEYWFDSKELETKHTMLSIRNTIADQNFYIVSKLYK